MEGACGKGKEAQVGWLEGMSAQCQVRADLHSKHKHVTGFLNNAGGQGVGRKPIIEEGQTCLVA